LLVVSITGRDFRMGAEHNSGGFYKLSDNSSVVQQTTAELCWIGTIEGAIDTVSTNVQLVTIAHECQIPPHPVGKPY